MHKYLEYKIRYLIFILVIVLLLFIGLLLLKKTYSKYITDVDVDVDIKAAMYVFEDETMNFNIDLNGIVPSDTPYIYSFSIANYNDTKSSDVDIEYKINIVTTTNMPLIYKLYRNEKYDTGVNIISDYRLVKDEDNVWYNKLDINDIFSFKYGVNSKDIYYLVVYFPLAYKSNNNYADCIDNIEVTVNSYQVID